MKRLFLASEAKHPKTFAQLEKYLGGWKGKSIAYIPTAANGEESFGTWQKGATYNLVKNTEAVIEPILLEDYKDRSVLSKLEGKDIIWFAGGACGYLMYWVRRCEIDKHIEKFLDSGSIYVGSSAGSMVCAPTLDIAESYVDYIEVGASVIPGFGLVKFNFYPHYDEKQLSEIKKLWKGGDIYLMKNGESLIVEGQKVEVLGHQRLLRNGELLTESAL